MQNFPKLRKTYELRRLHSIHKEVLRRAFLGQRTKDIALALGVTATMVSNTLNDPLAKKAMAKMEERGEAMVIDIRERIADLAPDAVSVLHKAMLDEEQPLRLRTQVAQDLLDRAGFAPSKKLEQSVGIGIFTQENIEQLKRGVQSVYNTNSEVSNDLVSVEVLDEEAS